MACVVPHTGLILGFLFSSKSVNSHPEVLVQLNLSQPAGSGSSQATLSCCTWLVSHLILGFLFGSKGVGSHPQVLGVCLHPEVQHAQAAQPYCHSTHEQHPVGVSPTVHTLQIIGASQPACCVICSNSVGIAEMASCAGTLSCSFVNKSQTTVMLVLSTDKW